MPRKNKGKAPIRGGSIRIAVLEKEVEKITYKLAEEDYIDFIKRVRMTVDGYEKVPTATDDASSSTSINSCDLLDVEIQSAKRRRKMALKMQKHDVYVAGYDIGTLYEFGPKNKKKKIFDNSVLLGFSESYGSLCGKEFRKISLGYHAFKKEHGGDDEIRKLSLATIIISISEAARFRWVLEDISTVEENENRLEMRVPQWMWILIHKWHPLSDTVRNYDPKIPSKLSKEEEERIETERDIEAILGDGKFASSVVVILQKKVKRDAN